VKNDLSDFFKDICSTLKNVTEKDTQKTALCPCHDDHNRSLSISLKNEKILIYCHAGCSLEDICNSLEINQWQLFSESFENRGENWEVEKAYDYRDENNKSSFQVIRGRGKNFTLDSHHLVVDSLTI
jgi:hypothetical protein